MPGLHRLKPVQCSGNMARRSGKYSKVGRSGMLLLFLYESDALKYNKKYIDLVDQLWKQGNCFFVLSLEFTL